MNLFPIRKPSTADDFGRAIWEIIDRLQQQQLLQSSTVQIVPTLHGYSIEVTPGGRGGGGTISLYQVQTIKRDHLVCRRALLVDGVWETDTDDVNVAKPFIFQYFPSINVSIGGVVWGAPNEKVEVVPVNGRDMKCVKRLISRSEIWTPSQAQALNQTVAFYQEIWPPYVEQSTVIAVMESTDPVLQIGEEVFGTPPDEITEPELTISKIDVNVDGRSWMDAYDQFDVCDTDGQQKEQLLRASVAYSHG